MTTSSTQTIFTLLLLCSFPALAAVDLNNASKEELASVKGIGPIRAQSIINYRRKHAFRQVDDLNKVKGFGPRSVANMRDELTVDEPMHPGKASSKKPQPTSQKAKP